MIASYSSNRFLQGRKVLGIYEHQVLMPGDRYGNADITLSDIESILYISTQTRCPFCQPYGRGLRFSHFVGIIDTGNLIIELLPKLDRSAVGYANREVVRWQNVLIDLLIGAGMLPRPIGESQVGTGSKNLLLFFIQAFLQRLWQEMAHRGLPKSYQPVVENSTSLQGAIDFPKHLQHNLIDKQRFYIRTQRFIENHSSNRILSRALSLLQERYPGLPLLTDVKHAFRQIPSANDAELQYDRSLNNRDHSEAYQSLVLWAIHFIKGSYPTVEAGYQSGISMLFDMNQLYEQFISTQLTRTAPPGWEVDLQHSRGFWKHHRLRPDIVLRGRHETIVIDCKWKDLSDQSPSSSDLQQLFSYCQVFGAQRGILLYPSYPTAVTEPPVAYQTAKTDTKPTAQVAFANLISDSGIHANFGIQFWKELESAGG